jgi:hypothetical protein
MKSSELHTRKRHNEGVQVDVHNEAGDVVGWLRVRGIDSDAYREAHDGYNQAMVRLAVAVRAGGADATLLPATKAEKEEAKLAERVALVSGWSFEDACTPDSVADFFRETPYVADNIFYLAQQRDLFFVNCSPTSTAGPNTNSDSGEPQQPAQSEPLPTP